MSETAPGSIFDPNFFRRIRNQTLLEIAKDGMKGLVTEEQVQRTKTEVTEEGGLILDLEEQISSLSIAALSIVGKNTQHSKAEQVLATRIFDKIGDNFSLDARLQQGWATQLIAQGDIDPAVAEVALNEIELNTLPRLENLIAIGEAAYALAPRGHIDLRDQLGDALATLRPLHRTVLARRAPSLR